jgi:hypothetical protein
MMLSSGKPSAVVVVVGVGVGEGVGDGVGEGVGLFFVRELCTVFNALKLDVEGATSAAQSSAPAAQATPLNGRNPSLISVVL